MTLSGMIFKYTSPMLRQTLLETVGWKHSDSFHTRSDLIKVIEYKI